MQYTYQEIWANYMADATGSQEKRVRRNVVLPKHRTLGFMMSDECVL